MLKTQILHNNEIIEGRFEDLGQKHTTVWVDMTDPTPAQLEALSAHVGVSALDIEGLLLSNQRPVLQDVGKFSAVVFHAPESVQKTTHLRPHLLLVSKEQKDFISVHRGDSQALQKIATYAPRRKIEIFQKGSTALLHSALSEMISSGFPVLDQLSEEISKLEEQAFQAHLSSQVMKKIFSIKKDLIYFQRALSADREVISEIEKSYGQFLDSKQLSSFRLLYSDLTQLIEIAATYREVIISTVEVHLASISNNLNVVMKRLTAWAAIILVPSLIAGIYGMNLAFLPWAKDPRGFWYVILAMLVSVWGLYGYFKKQDWV